MKPPAINEPNGPVLVGVLELLLDISAAVTTLSIALGDIDTAAVSAARQVRAARALGLYVEGEE